MCQETLFGDLRSINLSKMNFYTVNDFENNDDRGQQFDSKTYRYSGTETWEAEIANRFQKPTIRRCMPFFFISVLRVAHGAAESNPSASTDLGMAALVLRHQQRRNLGREAAAGSAVDQGAKASSERLERSNPLGPLIGGTFKLSRATSYSASKRSVLSGLKVSGIEEIAGSSVMREGRASRLSVRGLWQQRLLFLTQDNLYIAAERVAPTKEGWIGLVASDMGDGDGESESNVDQVYLVLAEESIAYWRSEIAHINKEHPEACMPIRACTMSFSGFLPGAHRAIPLLTIHSANNGHVFEFGCESIADRSAWLDVFTSHKQHAERKTVRCEVIDIIRLRNVEAVERLDSTFFGTQACRSNASKLTSKDVHSKCSGVPGQDSRSEQMRRAAFGPEAVDNFVITDDDAGFFLSCRDSHQPYVCFRTAPPTGKTKTGAANFKLTGMPDLDVEDLDVEEWMGLISKTAAAAKYEHERLHRFMQMQSRGQQLMLARPTQMFLGLVIVASFFTIVCEAQLQAEEGSHAAYVLGIIDLLFLAIFVAELLVNLFCFWWWPFWQDGWLRFDFAVVALSVCQLLLEYSVGSSVPGIKQLRVLRTFRIIKAFGRNKELRKIIQAVVASIGRTLSLSLPSLCLSACPPVCLSACLSVCLSACLRVCCLPVCLSVCLPVCLPVCLLAYKV